MLGVQDVICLPPRLPGAGGPGVREGKERTGLGACLGQSFNPGSCEGVWLGNRWVSPRRSCWADPSPTCRSSEAQATIVLGKPEALEE